MTLSKELEELALQIKGIDSAENGIVDALRALAEKAGRLAFAFERRRQESKLAAQSEAEVVKLYVCDHFTGRDHFCQSGPESEMPRAMLSACRRGEDVWLVFPDGRKELPPVSQANGLEKSAISSGASDSVDHRPLDEKLDGIRSCISQGRDEDAMENIFDLLRGLRVKDKPDDALTRAGKASKSLWGQAMAGSEGV